MMHFTIARGQRTPATLDAIEARDRLLIEAAAR